MGGWGGNGRMSTSDLGMEQILWARPTGCGGGVLFNHFLLAVKRPVLYSLSSLIPGRRRLQLLENGRLGHPGR
jgi:hypothetical protein